MSTFVPSAYSGAYGYGDPDEGAKTTTAEKVEQWSPLISDLLFGDDPRQELEKKKANLTALQKTYESTTGRIAQNTLAWQINKLTGEIEALETMAGEARTAVWTTQANKIAAALLLLGGTVTVLTGAWVLLQKGKTEKALRAAK